MTRLVLNLHTAYSDVGGTLLIRRLLIFLLTAFSIQLYVLGGFLFLTLAPWLSNCLQIGKFMCVRSSQICMFSRTRWRYKMVQRKDGIRGKNYRTNERPQFIGQPMPGYSIDTNYRCCPMPSSADWMLSEAYRVPVIFSYSREWLIDIK
jgi:hypothetical protein